MIPASTVDKPNTSVQTDLVGVPFGPIAGLQSKDYVIAWNNRHQLLFIEILSDTIETTDGIPLGDDAV